MTGRVAFMCPMLPGCQERGNRVARRCEVVEYCVAWEEVGRWSATDAHQISPMLKQLQKRYHGLPPEVLVDGGFAGLNAIDEVEREGM